MNDSPPTFAKTEGRELPSGFAGTDTCLNGEIDTNCEA